MGIAAPIVQRGVAADHQISIVDERLSLELSVPQDVAMTRVVERSDDEACPSVPYLFADRLAIEAYSTTCDPSSRNPMNGRYGRYRSFDDVADPLDAVTVDTRLGPATLFTQEYTKCTNACRHAIEQVGIIALEDPQTRNTRRSSRAAAPRCRARSSARSSRHCAAPSTALDAPQLRGPAGGSAWMPSSSPVDWPISIRYPSGSRR